MSTDDLNKLASQNVPMPDGLTQEQQLLYLQLLQLYELNRYGKMTREQAIICKNKLIFAYRERVQISDKDRNLQEVKKHIGEKIIFRGSEYTISGIRYSAELQDKCGHSITIATLEEIERTK